MGVVFVSYIISNSKDSRSEVFRELSREIKKFRTGVRWPMIFGSVLGFILNFALAALSGMSKQEYCIRRMLQRDVVVVGNPRVHKVLKIQMEQLCREFSKLCSVNDVNAEALHVMDYLTKLYKGLEYKQPRDPIPATV